MNIELLKKLSVKTESRIVLLVIDGLGGLADPDSGKTELETARTPNLDQLASQAICGMVDPVAPGITPGSGPGHLALFGYDPVSYNMGRGVLEAAGIDFDLQKGDIAARGNFATADREANITDRRAGRLSTDENRQLCLLLDCKVIEGTTILVRPIKEHRFLLVLRGSDLSEKVTDTDPQKTGVRARECLPLIPRAQRTAGIVNAFVSKARQILSGRQPANMLLLRGFSAHPDLPQMSEIYKLNPAAIAIYPMYRGLSKLVGMKALNPGTDMAGEFQALVKNYGLYDFFFLHIKHADSRGEDGDFQAKVAVLEDIDRLIPQIRELKPDVMVVTGDHSTPALLKGHSWHPVPFMLVSKWSRPDGVKKFGEEECLKGGLGRMPALYTMPLAMANALKLEKFGA